MTDRARLASLRQLFQGKPSPQRWAEAMALLKDWPWMSVQIGIDYVEGRADRWPDAIRAQPPWLQWEVAHPAWALVRHLDLRHQPLGTPGAMRLARSERLARVTWLNLEGCQLGDEGLAALLASPALRPLQQLLIADNNLGPAAADALANATSLASLIRLDLSRNPLGDPGLIALLPALAGLTHLNARHTGLTRASAEAAADSRALRRLVALDFGDNHIDADGAAALAASTALRALEILRLGGNPLGDPGAEAFADSPWLPNLILLALDRCQIGPEGAAALARSPHTARLHHLDLRGNPIDRRCALDLLDDPRVRALKTLRLTLDGLDLDGLDALADHLGVNLEADAGQPPLKPPGDPG